MNESLKIAQYMILEFASKLLKETSPRNGFEVHTGISPVLYKIIIFNNICKRKIHKNKTHAYDYSYNIINSE